MPDRSPRQPVYRCYQPKNLAVVRINGKDIYLGKYGSPESWERYGRALAEWRATGLTPKPATAAESEGLLIKELVLLYWKHVETYYRRADGDLTGEHLNYRYSLKPLKTLFGTTPAREFGPKRLKVVREHMIESGLSRRVINQDDVPAVVEG